MAAGEARLILEAGTSRFPVRMMIGKRPVTADTMLDVLPILVRDLGKSLERIKDREQRTANENAADSKPGVGGE